MEKVRIGNDIQVKYTVLRDGQPESFVGATNIVVEVKNEAYAKIIPSTFSIVDNVVNVVLDAKDCVLCGKHRVTLSYNRGNDITIDALAFELVQFTSLTGGTEIVGVEIVTVNISGDIGIAIPDNNKIDLDGLNSNIDKLHFKPDTLVQLAEIGDVRYSPESKTLEVKVSDTVSIQLGQEMQTRVKNDAGVQINNGQLVYIDSASGANPLAKIASTTDADIAQRTFGMATENIASNGFGAITTEGLVRDIDTSAFAEGAMLWLGINGAVTNIEPVAPTQKISVGMVLRSNVNSGVIYVKIRAIARNQKLSDVYAPTLTGGDVLRWNSTNLRFETFNVTTALAGKADLVGGKIPTSQLPAYVDDVLEYANLAAFPVTGEAGKIYVALDTNLTYRWSGSAYVEISKSLALGETSSTAYRGDRGKTAYDHSQATGNVHGTTASQITNTPAGTIAATTVQGAINELASDIVQVETDLNRGSYRSVVNSRLCDSNDVERNGYAIAAVDSSEPVRTNYSITKYIPVKAGMNLRYIGWNTNVESSWATAYFYDLNFKPISPLTKTVISASSIFDYTILSDGYVKFAYDYTKSFEVLFKNTIDYTSIRPVSNPINLIIGQNSLTEIGMIDFSGNAISSVSYKRSSLIRIKPSTKYLFRGYLRNGASIAVYDCNGRFIESYIGYKDQPVASIYGEFITHIEAFYIRVCTNINSLGDTRAYPFWIAEVENFNYNLATVMSGVKTGGDFELVNGIRFKSLNTENSWENIISILNRSDKKLSNSYIFEGSKIIKTLQPNVVITDFKFQEQLIDLKSIGVSGIWASYSNNIYLSTDYGATFYLIDTIDKYLGASIVGIREDENGNLYISLRLPSNLFDTYGIEEELIKYTKTISGWTSDYAAKISIAHNAIEGSYGTISLKWGFTSYDNVVLVSDYGTQGVTGRAWLSRDYGETFVKIFDLYESPLSQMVSNGHVHGSCFDYTFNRIWISTGDGYTNTYIFYSDNYGETWDSVQVYFKSLITGKLKSIQHTKILSFYDSVLFLDDSPYAGCWIYNRNSKLQKPIIEWICDITDHDLNQMGNSDTQMAGLTLEKHNNLSPVVMGHSWHDVQKGNSGVLGNIAVSQDNYNWYVVYKDSIDPLTGRGYIGPSSLVFSDDKYIYCSTELRRIIKIDIRFIFF